MNSAETPSTIGAHQFIRYSINRWDILRWQFYLLTRNRLLIIFGLIASLALAWNDLQTPAMRARPIGFKVFYIVFFTAAFLTVIGSATMFMMSFRAMFKKYQGFLGEHELQIRDDGLLERTDFNESLHRWAGFHKIVRTGRYLYIYVTDSSIHIIPRRYFASDHDEKAFRGEIEKRIKPA